MQHDGEVICVYVVLAGGGAGEVIGVDVEEQRYQYRALGDTILESPPSASLTTACGEGKLRFDNISITNSAPGVCQTGLS